MGTFRVNPTKNSLSWRNRWTYAVIQRNFNLIISHTFFSIYLIIFPIKFCIFKINKFIVILHGFYFFIKIVYFIFQKIVYTFL
jgi:hypothetical protein